LWDSCGWKAGRTGGPWKTCFRDIVLIGGLWCCEGSPTDVIANSSIFKAHVPWMSDSMEEWESGYFQPQSTIINLYLNLIRTYICPVLNVVLTIRGGVTWDWYVVFFNLFCQDSNTGYLIGRNQKNTYA
jgi:hypothetical protein